MRACNHRIKTFGQPEHGSQHFFILPNLCLHHDMIGTSKGLVSQPPVPFLDELELRSISPVTVIGVVEFLNVAF